VSVNGIVVKGEMRSMTKSLYTLYTIYYAIYKTIKTVSSTKYSPQLSQ